MDKFKRAMESLENTEKVNKILSDIFNSIELSDIIYLSGAVTNDIETAEARFNNMARQLQMMGFHNIINPYKMCEGFLYRARHSTYMGVCLKALESADTIFMLKGYECSVGAIMERDEAIRLGLKVVYE